MCTVPTMGNTYLHFLQAQIATLQVRCASEIRKLNWQSPSLKQAFEKCICNKMCKHRTELQYLNKGCNKNYLHGYNKCIYLWIKKRIIRLHHQTSGYVRVQQYLVHWVRSYSIPIFKKVQYRQTGNQWTGQEEEIEGWRDFSELFRNNKLALLLALQIVLLEHLKSLDWKMLAYANLVTACDHGNASVQLWLECSPVLCR